MSPTGNRQSEQLAVVRGAWGALLLAAPGQLISSVPGADSTRAARAIAQVLGARHLLQATAALAGSQTARRAWWVDALHSASMVAFAVVSPTSRRLAAADAPIAAAFAVATRAADSSSSDACATDGGPPRFRAARHLRRLLLAPEQMSSSG
jgi:hypothetical protein